jgi:heme/copper-type cytochrome/quinol oxidase subunit 4
MAEVIYVLCAITSSLCAALLTRSYFHTRTRMLLWSALGFVGLAVNNIILFVDLAVVTDTDLAMARTVAALVGMVLLVVGLIWEDQ